MQEGGRILHLRLDSGQICCFLKKGTDTEADATGATKGTNRWCPMASVQEGSSGTSMYSTRTSEVGNSVVCSKSDDDDFGSMNVKDGDVYAIKKSKPIEGMKHRYAILSYHRYGTCS